jgi:enoyl-CoA hydratase/carnithine racemase
VSDERPVLVERRGAVALLTLNRPERNNAYTYAMQDALHDALDATARDSAVRAVVITGSGGSFCPGFDAEALAAATHDGARTQDELRPVTYPALLPKPIVAAINGGCAGIGLVTALLCDIRVAADTARFSTAFARLGLPAERTASWLLPRIVGHAAALELLLTARVIDAGEARRLGLVHNVVAFADLTATALDLAEQIADRCSPRAMAAAKAQVYGDWTRSLEDSRRHAAARLAELIEGPDFVGAVAASQGKDAPAFAGFATAIRRPGHDDVGNPVEPADASE